MSASATPSRRRVAALALVFGLIVLGGLVWLVAKQFAAPDSGKKKRVIQEISLMKPPPPPPPPPKVEPPKQQIQEKVETPKPDQQPEKQTQAPPPGPDLGLDAKGTDGGDGFGLTAKKGGADLIGGAGAGAGSGSRFAWYGALVRERIQDAVAKDEKLRGADYRVSVNVWVNASGAVTRADLLGTTGDAEHDKALTVALRNLPPLREGAPLDMPQPIKLRITAR